MNEKIEIIGQLDTLFEAGFLPPLCVLNDTTRRGVIGSGASTISEWEPFELDSVEYKQLNDQLNLRVLDNKD